jgi:hypothetical protein
MKIWFPLLLAAAFLAQAAPPEDRAAALKESLAQNQAALRKYSWIETTQISLKGEVKKQEQKQCSYGADGKVTKTPMPGASPAAAQPQQKASEGGKRGGRLKQQIVENKVEDMKEYFERVSALVQEYVPPDSQKIQAAQAAGNVSTKPAGNGVTLNVKDYLKPGDALAIGFDPAAKQLTSYSVHSFVDKPKEDDVDLLVTFGKLEDGTSYPQKTVLNVKAKKIDVTVTNSGYKKTGA